jgi:hypothetical protein
LGIGSRDETTKNQGIAHFWEHMAFKGTKKRTSIDIIESLDSIGGELNAFTDKEKIVFYASVRDRYFERAGDVLTDITFKSTFPVKELEKERGVILEEMSMYFDSPDDSLQDELEALIFKNHPLGMNILGSAETVKISGRKTSYPFLESMPIAERSYSVLSEMLLLARLNLWCESILSAILCSSLTQEERNSRPCFSLTDMLSFEFIPGPPMILDIT